MVDVYELGFLRTLINEWYGHRATSEDPINKGGLHSVDGIWLACSDSLVDTDRHVAESWHTRITIERWLYRQCSDHVTRTIIQVSGKVLPLDHVVLTAHVGNEIVENRVPC